MGMHTVRVQSANPCTAKTRQKSKNAQNIEKTMRLIAERRPKLDEAEMINGIEFALIHQFTSGTTIIRALQNVATKKRSIAFVRIIKGGTEVEVVDADKLPHLLALAVRYERPVFSAEDGVDVCLKENLKFLFVEPISHKARNLACVRDEVDHE